MKYKWGLRTAGIALLSLDLTSIPPWWTGLVAIPLVIDAVRQYRAS